MKITERRLRRVIRQVIRENYDMESKDERNNFVLSVMNKLRMGGFEVEYRKDAYPRYFDEPVIIGLERDLSDGCNISNILKTCDMGSNETREDFADACVDECQRAWGRAADKMPISHGAAGYMGDDELYK